MEKFDIDWLKKNAESIHYFGLGFIQVKINFPNRIHFYTTQLDKTVQEEEIHNHRYNFKSQILKGRFTQTIFTANKTDLSYTHYMTQESCNENDKTEFPLLSVNLIEESYYMDHNTFHTVESEEGTITHLIRGNYQKQYADVVFQKDKTLTCPFSIKVSEDDLYDIIKPMLKDVFIIQI